MSSIVKHLAVNTLILIALCPVQSHAGRADELFAPFTEVMGEELVLNGSGVLRFKKLIPVYDAALYLPLDAKPKEILGGTPRRLEVVYRRGATAEQFAKAGAAVLAKSFSEADLALLQDRLTLINSWYPDPEQGDRCAITYVPGRGTELSFNGKPLGVIEGDDFAHAYFSIWLGAEPASVGLRNDLLGSLIE